MSGGLQKSTSTRSPAHAAGAYREDTIAALATPPGAGGIAVVRLSGPDCLTLAGQISDAPFSENPRHAFRTRLHDPATGAALDDALVTYFKSPASYTGEELMEFSTHGGLLTPQRLLAVLFAGGARPAEPGEFSLRAFLNGKLDLARAEAVNQLIHSMSSRGQAAAVENVEGRLTNVITGLRDEMVKLLTILEHELDFSEDEIAHTTEAQITATLATATAHLRRLQSTAAYGRILREGVRVVIAGAPNSGKSSLFNALVGLERAIVSPFPGTTRDTLDAWQELAGYAVCLVDTAGYRDTDDPVEAEGVRRTHAQLQSADIVLVLDPDDPVSVARGLTIGSEKTIIYVRSKSDLHSGATPAELVTASVRSDAGLDGLLDRLKAALETFDPGSEYPVVALNRHATDISAALEHLQRALDGANAHQPADLVATDIRLAADALGQIIGVTTQEDIIQRIFSEFCVGK